MNPAASSLEDRVADRLHACLRPVERRWVVAVSGGADSLFLLQVAHRLAPRLGARLHVVHLNHGWRGADSDRDERLVRVQAARLGWPLSVACAPPLPAGRNKQDWARECRRHVLESCAGPDDVILLGHQAWDQSETVLAGLLKGKAPWGLRPLQERDGRWLRPLLGVGGAELRRRCGELGLEWREDASNADGTHERGHLRHRLLAPLRQVAGDEVDQLLAGIARKLAQAALEHAGNLEDLLVKLDLQPTPVGWSLERAPFLPYHEALSPDLLRRLGRRLGWWSRDPARRTLSLWARQLAEARSGSRFPLGSGRWLELGRERAWVVDGPWRPQLRRLRPGQEIQLLGKRISWNAGPLAGESWRPAAGDEARTVLLRSWLPGDRLRVSPTARRLLADLMGERGYAPAQKRLQLVLQVDGEIRWCPGLGRAWPPEPSGAKSPHTIWVGTCTSPSTR
ncbi:MAG: tRNA lysidine(34) synthetase TilS [Candidatus Delongbacteria bacterium]